MPTKGHLYGREGVRRGRRVLQVVHSYGLPGFQIHSFFSDEQGSTCSLTTTIFCKLISIWRSFSALLQYLNREQTRRVAVGHILLGAYTPLVVAKHGRLPWQQSVFPAQPRNAPKRSSATVDNLHTWDWGMQTEENTI